MKPKYLEGVKECERLYQSGYTFTELYEFIELEESIGGYKWSVWVEGFVDTIEHFENLEEMSNENI